MDNEIAIYDILEAYVSETLSSVTLKNADKWRFASASGKDFLLNGGTPLFVNIVNGNIMVAELYCFAYQYEVSISMTTMQGGVLRAEYSEPELDLRDPDFEGKFHKTIINILRKADLLSSWNAMLAEWGAK